jgi:hypothetical protein
MRARQPSVMSADIQKHFEAKLRVLVIDTLDTLERGGVDPCDAITVVVSPLIQNLTWIIEASGGDEADAIELVQVGFDARARTRARRARA